MGFVTPTPGPMWPPELKHLAMTRTSVHSTWRIPHVFSASYLNVSLGDLERYLVIF